MRRQLRVDTGDGINDVNLHDGAAAALKRKKSFSANETQGRGGSSSLQMRMNQEQTQKEKKQEENQIGLYQFLKLSNLQRYARKVGEYRGSILDFAAIATEQEALELCELVKVFPEHKTKFLHAVRTARELYNGPSREARTGSGRSTATGTSSGYGATTATRSATGPRGSPRDSVYSALSTGTIGT